MRDGIAHADHPPERETIGHSKELPLAKLERAIGRAESALLLAQHAEGSWCFELEADCTIPAEYILMMHYMGAIDQDLEGKLASYLRAHQGEDGGWPLYYGGRAEISCSVKAYYALKLAGDQPELSHMARAREAILRLGGASRANVFTRIALAIFGQLPWRAVPFLPVEIVFTPTLVSFSPVQSLLLVAHRHGAIIYPLHV